MELPLSNTSGFVIVDDDVYNELRGKSIWLDDGYAKFWDPVLRNVKVHRYVMGFPDLCVDHKNRNKLDCRRSNLRLCTRKENSYNKGKQKGTFTSRYKGVFYHKHSRRWKAGIRHEGKQYHLGTFKTEREAALAYNNGAIIYHKLFACLNIIAD